MFITSQNEIAPMIKENIRNYFIRCYALLPVILIMRSNLKPILSGLKLYT